MNNKLTVLVGAGGSEELGCPSTEEITEALIKQEQSFEEKQVLKYLFSEIQKYYTKPKPNFEHLLHALETISSLMISWGDETKDRYKIMEGVLCGEPRDNMACLFNRRDIGEAELCFFQTLHSLFYKACHCAGSHDDWNTYQTFWKKLASDFELDIATLNYDTFIETALPHVEQGFEQIKDNKAKCFEIKKFCESKHRLMHLHGSIHYGDSNFENDFQDLSYFDDAAEALKTWGNRSHHRDQTGRTSIIGPLITGMEKTAKILAADPYATYYWHFYQTIMESPRLLIIGYGFSDHHINSILSRFTKLHGDSRRVVIIDRCPENEWNGEPAEGWAKDKPDKFKVIAMLCKMSRPMSNLNYLEKWESCDKHCRTYWVGFLKSISNYSQDIINFLK